MINISEIKDYVKNIKIFTKNNEKLYNNLNKPSYYLVYKDSKYYLINESKDKLYNEKYIYKSNYSKDIEFYIILELKLLKNLKDIFDHHNNSINNLIGLDTNSKNICIYSFGNNIKFEMKLKFNSFLQINYLVKKFVEPKTDAINISNVHFTGDFLNLKKNLYYKWNEINIYFKNTDEVLICFSFKNKYVYINKMGEYGDGRLKNKLIKIDNIAFYKLRYFNNINTNVKLNDNYICFQIITDNEEYQLEFKILSIK